MHARHQRCGALLRVIRNHRLSRRFDVLPVSDFGGIVSS